MGSNPTPSAISTLVDIVVLVGMKLRLADVLARALRQGAAVRGTSQQEIIRTAIAKELGLVTQPTAVAQAVTSGLVNPPTSFQEAVEAIRLPRGTTTMDLLDRDDR